MQKTVLLLGAGASRAMGYPIGIELRNSIIKGATGEYCDLIWQSLNGSKADVLNFVEAFGRSQMYSIDAFLAKRPEFSEIGKAAIAAILLSKENRDLLHTNDHPDNWYAYLFNIMAANSWEDLDFSWLTIITFNYDRSFESYFLSAMQSAYGKKIDECWMKFSSIKIIHIYGVLGECNPSTESYRVYGSEVGHLDIKKALNSLKVIPEGRQDDQVLTEARTELKSAERLGFLGFGFDKTNLERLDSKNTCMLRVNNDPGIGGMRHRIVFATSFGMTNHEITKASIMTIGDYPEGRFYNKTCLEMLRESGLLIE